MAAPATKAEQQAFIDKMLKAIKKQRTLYGLFPSVIIAQAALESGWGKSKLSNPYNNFFGIKASATQYSDAWNPRTGRTVNLNTLEYDNGYNSQVATWRVYNSAADSVKDRNALVANNSRYAAALKAATPRQQIAALKAGGYATEPNYVERVMSIVNSNSLTDYDTPEPETEQPETEQPAQTEKKNRLAVIIPLAVAVALLVAVVVLIIKTNKK